MIRYLLLLIFIVINSPLLFCQFEKVTEQKLDCSFLTSDPEMNIYAISGDYLLKYPPPYSSAHRYNLGRHSQPDNFDVYAGERVVIYYQDSRKLIILGDTLQEIIRPIYLEELGMNEISLVISSEDNGLWFYDYLNNSITKLNESFIPVIRSLKLNRYFVNPKTPSFMVCFKNNIYINIPSTGILVLDANGNYKTGLVMPGLIDFQMDGDFICYFRDNEINRYNTLTHITDKVYIPKIPDVVNAHIHKDELFLFRHDGFYVYKNKISTKNNF